MEKGLQVPLEERLLVQGVRVLPAQERGLPSLSRTDEEEARGMEVGPVHVSCYGVRIVGWERENGVE